MAAEPEEEISDPSAKTEKSCTPPLIFNRSVFIALGLGQTLSLFICGTAVTSGLLQRNGASAPTAQSFLNYLLLGLTYGPILACAPKEHCLLQILKERWWKYLLLAVVDVEANYLMVKAYQYTTVTSVQLLDCFTIPTVLVLSWVFLKSRYQLLHYVGVFACLLGIGSLILADVLVEKYAGQKASNKLLGDFLCIGGALLYGVSNVAQEFVVRNFNRKEFLGMIGIFGSFVSGIQLTVLERKEISRIDFTSYKIVLLLLGFAVCLYLLYSLMPIVIARTSATAVNLNLLSADFYALLFGLFLFKDKFHPLYFVSIIFIIGGVVTYSMRPVRQVSQVNACLKGTPDRDKVCTFCSQGTTRSCSCISRTSDQGTTLGLLQEEEKVASTDTRTF